MNCCSPCHAVGKFGLGLLIATAVAGLALGFPPPEKTAEKPAEKPAQADKASTVNPYPLDVCIISGEKLGGMGKPVVKVYDGREVRFCCNGCVKDFEKEKVANLKKIDAKIVEQQLPHYPLTTCVVMDEDAVSGGDADDAKTVNYVYNNRLVRFCCSNCIKEFKADPAKYMKKIDDAVIKQQKPNYPLDSDVVTGAKLGPDAVDYVFGVSLVRLANKDSIAQFNADPPKYVAKLHDAWMSKKPHGKDDDSKGGKDDHHDHDHDGHNHGG